MDIDDAEKQDIVLVKETGKFIINDLEMPSLKTAALGKRKAPEITKDRDSEDDSSVGDNVSDDSSNEGDLKGRLKQATKRQKTGPRDYQKVQEQFA